MNASPSQTPDQATRYSATWGDPKARWFQGARWALGSLLPLLGWVFSLCPSAAEAQFSYKVTYSQVTITGYNGPGGTVRIPDAIEGFPVVEVARNAFYKAQITRVIVPNTMQRMYRNAFYDCTNIVGAYFYGNAPQVVSTVGVFNFGVFDYGIVYHLPGTTGWEPWFGGAPGFPALGRPTALWRPEVVTGDTSFGVKSNRFGFNMFWTEGGAIVVEACADVAHPVWQQIKTNAVPTGTAYFSDPQWTQYSRRSYRLRAAP